MGWHIIHGSVVENILIQNSIVLIQEKEAPPGLSRDRDDVREKRVRGEQLQRQQTEDAEAESEKENKELATRATEGELD